MLGERIEIAIVMEQRVASNEAECAYDHIDGLADRNVACSEEPEVPGRLKRDALVEHWHDRIATQVALDPGGMRLVTRSPEHLE